MTPTTTFARFLDYISLELNYSERTVAAYGADLAAWEAWATEGTKQALDPSSVRVNDLRLYVAHLARRKMAVSSIHRKVQALRAFYKFLMREGQASANPAADLSLAKMPRSLPVYIRQEETEALLGDDPGDGFDQLRDYAMVMTLYSTGMRVSEMCRLSDLDADTSRRQFKVLGKRDKERIIPFGDELARLLDRYRAVRDAQYEKPQTPGSPLFIRERGEAMDRVTAYRIVHNFLAEGGAHAARLSPHVLRHCFATDMLNNGADLTTVRRLLGHASLGSTQIYTHVGFNQMKEAYARAHPRGNAETPVTQRNEKKE